MHVCTRHVNVLVNKQYQMTVILFRFVHAFNCRGHTYNIHSMYIHMYVHITYKNEKRNRRRKKTCSFQLSIILYFHAYIHMYVCILELQYLNNNNLKETK